MSFRWLQSPPKTENTIVKVNVGGKLFHTSRMTLEKLNEEVILKHTDKCSFDYFIDGNPTHFDTVLDYIRTSNAYIPNDVEDVMELQKDAEYYKLEGLELLCSEKIERLNRKVKLVKFLVGGKLFSCSLENLKKFDGKLKEMAENGDFDNSEEDKVIEIDRSHRWFHHIQNFMRDGECVIPEDAEEIKQLKMEASFFRFNQLSETCEMRLEELNLKKKSVVNLNIGGTNFVVGRGTIIDNNIVLKELLLDETKTEYFVDRNPKHFPLILHFLRDGFCVLPDDEFDLIELLMESDYYGTETLTVQCRSRLQIIKSEERLYQILSKLSKPVVILYFKSEEFSRCNIDLGGYKNRVDLYFRKSSENKFAVAIHDPVFNLYSSPKNITSTAIAYEVYHHVHKFFLEKFNPDLIEW